MTLTPRALAALRAVAATLVGGGADQADLVTRVADHVAMLPRAADRAELELVLRLFESRVVNLCIARIPRPFSAMTPTQRERYLRGWATSPLPPRRKAFQALKRLVTVTHYTTPGAADRVDPEDVLQIMERCMEADTQTGRYIQLVLVLEALMDSLGVALAVAK